jgi:hypothetical protein
LVLAELQLVTADSAVVKLFLEAAHLTKDLTTQVLVAVELAVAQAVEIPVEHLLQTQLVTAVQVA